MFPVRCYTCNAVLAQNPPQPVHRICCRRMFLGYVDLTTDQVQYGNVDVELAPGVILRRKVVHTRVVSCD
jgi:hypothetical protein